MQHKRFSFVVVADLAHHAQWNDKLMKQAVGGRPPQYAPAPLLPLWAPKRLAPPSRGNVAVVSRGQYVPTLTAAAG